MTYRLLTHILTYGTGVTLIICGLRHRRMEDQRWESAEQISASWYAPQSEPQLLLCSVHIEMRICFSDSTMTRGSLRSLGHRERCVDRLWGSWAPFSGSGCQLLSQFSDFLQQLSLAAVQLGSASVQWDWQDPKKKRIWVYWYQNVMIKTLQNDFELLKTVIRKRKQLHKSFSPPFLQSLLICCVAVTDK